MPITVIIGILPLFGCNTTSLPDSSSAVSETSSVSSAAGDEVTAHILRLPYDSDDSLNPFTAKTVINTALIPVLYDSLFRLDEEFQAEPLMAASITGAGTEYTVTLREGLVFSDGSKVSASDVVYSFEQARRSARYQTQLENVSSATASGDTVVFRLKTADPLFANLLDFAVVKRNTANTSFPIGSGRYIAKADGTSAKLICNTRHFGEDTPAQEELPLVSMPDAEAMLSGIKAGSLSAVFSDLSKGELSTAGALSLPVDLSNLVYLGFHTGHDFINEPTVRQAIAAAIDRGTVFYQGFGGQGQQASLPIHPAIGAGQEIEEALLLQHDTDKANQLLDDAGYAEKDAGGFRLKDGAPITVNILVNADNSFKKLAASLIKEMLTGIGIRAVVSEKPFSAYLADVAAGNYDLYIGEMKLLNNMSLSPLLDDPAILGGERSDALFSAYQAYLDGSGSYSDFIAAFHQEIPFLPLLFRSGVLIYNRNIRADIKVSPTDVYYNLEEWK